MLVQWVISVNENMVFTCTFTLQQIQLKCVTRDEVEDSNAEIYQVSLITK